MLLKYFVPRDLLQSFSKEVLAFSSFSLRQYT
jgi:hypothetical protein